MVPSDLHIPEAAQNETETPPEVRPLIPGGRRLGRFLPFAILLLVAVVLTRGVSKGEFNIDNDETIHAFTGRYIADFLSDLPLAHPIQYTYAYYGQLLVGPVSQGRSESLLVCVRIFCQPCLTDQAAVHLPGFVLPTYGNNSAEVASAGQLERRKGFRDHAAPGGSLLPSCVQRALAGDLGTPCALAGDLGTPL